MQHALRARPLDLRQMTDFSMYYTAQYIFQSQTHCGFLHRAKSQEFSELSRCFHSPPERSVNNTSEESLRALRVDRRDRARVEMR